MKRQWIGTCCALLLALASSVHAAPGVSLVAGGDFRWFDWREYGDGRQLLAETGPQALGLLQLSAQSAAWRASVESGWGGGIAHYDGHLQSGPNYEADAVETVTDTDWRLAWLGARSEVSVGILQRDWRRFIEGSRTVSSAEERYRWRLLTWGMVAPLRETENWEWRLSARIGMPFERSEKVYLGGGYDDVSLEPGNGLYWRLALPLQSRAESRLVLEPYFQEQKLRRSDMVPMTQAGVPTGLWLYQPASVRRELGLALRWQVLAK